MYFHTKYKTKNYQEPKLLIWQGINAGINLDFTRPSIEGDVAVGGLVLGMDTDDDGCWIVRPTREVDICTLVADDEIRIGGRRRPICLHERDIRYRVVCIPIKRIWYLCAVRENARAGHVCDRECACADSDIRREGVDDDSVHEDSATHHSIRMGLGESR